MFRYMRELWRTVTSVGFLLRKKNVMRSLSVTSQTCGEVTEQTTPKA